MLEAKGRNGQMSFDGQTVVITREGMLARATHGRSEKRIPIGNVTAVQFKPYSLTGWGFLQLSVPGEQAKSGGRSGKQSRNAADDENAVTFAKGQQASFEALRDAIQAAQGAPAASAAAAPDATEQLLKLAQLRDAGAITADEYDAKKAELLDRI